MKYNNSNQLQEYSNTGYAPNIQTTTGSFSVAVTSQPSGQSYFEASSSKKE